MEICISHRSRPRHDATFLRLELYSSTFGTTPNDQSASASPCLQAWGKRTDSTKRSISLDRSLWYQNCCDTRVQVEQQRCLQQQIPLCWCPKYRRKVLEGKIAKRCEQVIRKTAAKYRAEIIALEIMPDHVHLLIEIDPQFGIHRLIKNIKGVSSHVLRKEFASLRTRLPSLWRMHIWFPP